MSDWPDNATRRSKPAVLAEARRRGLIARNGGEEWLYMFHDIHEVAHFRHVSRRAYMQMLPDETEADGMEDDGTGDDRTQDDRTGSDGTHRDDTEPLT